MQEGCQVKVPAEVPVGVNQWGQLTHNQEDMEEDQVGLGLYSMEQGEHLKVPLG